VLFGFRRKVKFEHKYLEQVATQHCASDAPIVEFASLTRIKSVSVQFQVEHLL
jgi:hypothetical protein